MSPRFRLAFFQLSFLHVSVISAVASIVLDDLATKDYANDKEDKQCSCASHRQTRQKHGPRSVCHQARAADELYTGWTVRYPPPCASCLYPSTRRVQWSGGSRLWATCFVQLCHPYCRRWSLLRARALLLLCFAACDGTDGGTLGYTLSSRSPQSHSLRPTRPIVCYTAA